MPNILVFPDRPPAVINWEFSRMGDPAFDLAIGGDPIRRSEVHLHESLPRRALVPGGAEPPEQALAKLKGILHRAEAS